MPFEHIIDHGSHLVVVRGTGEGSLEETSDSARRLLEDQSVCSDYTFMFVVDDIALYPTLEEMSSIVSILGSLRSRFCGRMAIVTSSPGRVTASLMVALAANDVYGNVHAFNYEWSAREWLLADTPPKGCASEDKPAPGA